VKFTLVENIDCCNKYFTESTNSRIYYHITNSNQWAIISPYRPVEELPAGDSNQKRMSQLKSDVRNLNLGFIQFISRWVENGEAFDEEALLIPNISRDKAFELGQKYNQSSIIYKDDKGCNEICTTPFETYSVGQIVRTYNLSGENPLNINDAEEIFSRKKSGPASKPKKGGNMKPFTLKEVYEVIQARPSMFHTRHSAFRIF